MSETVAISVVLPVYNQADHLEAVVDSYREVLDRIGHSYELILVTNGCRDNSVEIAKSVVARHSVVRLLESEVPGWGAAVKRGLKVTKGDVVCYTNLARTSAQDLALLILYAVTNPGNIVKANRKIRDNWRRRLGSLLYNLECRALFDLAYWDINGTPKVFPRSCEDLLNLQREDDLIDLEFNIVCRHRNYPILEVPIISTKRHGGASTTKMRSAIRMYVGAYKMRKQ